MRVRLREEPGHHLGGRGSYEGGREAGTFCRGGCDLYIKGKKHLGDNEVGSMSPAVSEATSVDPERLGWDLTQLGM